MIELKGMFDGWRVFGPKERHDGLAVVVFLTPIYRMKDGRYYVALTNGKPVMRLLAHAYAKGGIVDVDDVVSINVQLPQNSSAGSLKA